MNPSLNDAQKYLMKKIDKYTTKIHYIMLILDIISQIIEQDEDEMKQPKLMRSYNIEESSSSSDDDSIGTINTNDIELVDECSDEED